MQRINFLRLVPAVTLLLSLSTQPCACGVAVSGSSATSCCGPDTESAPASDHNSQPRGCDCCGENQNPSSTREHDSGLCCSACTDECEQPNALWWVPGIAISKSDVRLQSATQPPSVVLLVTPLGESASAPDRLSPATHCPTYISNHFLRI